MQAVSGFTQIDNCVICLGPQFEPIHWYDSFKQNTKDKVHTLACNHKFHRPCIQESINEQIKHGRAKEGKATCPHCRAITNLTSSSKQVGAYITVYSKILATALSIAVFATGIFVASRFIEPGFIAANSVALASWLVTKFIINVSNQHLSHHVVNVSLKLHQWKTGLSLTVDQLNFSELISDKKINAEYVKNTWKEHVQAIIEQKDEFPEITISDRLLDENTIELILDTTYANLREQDPGVFAALHNNSPHSDQWLDAFDESLNQLERDELLTFNEVV
ncbi:MAG: hypothetical protein LLF94_12700 [Chlamydiales bacterium]|nr:hypothetical protein [Chlamydiales bacterium]